MKHAVLIMAHKNINQVKRLINSLKCDEFDFFVHLDSKWNLTEEEIAEIKSIDKVFILNERISGELDKFSLVDITLKLAMLAKESGDYGYYLLLSGQDYPVKNINYITNFLNENYPKAFIDIDGYEKESYVFKKFLNMKHVEKMDEILESEQPSFKRKLKLLPHVIKHKISRLIFGESPNYKKLKKLGLEGYGGSAWWILPNKIIDFILNERTGESKFYKILEKVKTPEEIFFQTMVMNSPYKDLVEVIPANEKKGQNCLTYANFVTPTKPFRGHPHIIEIEDYERINGGGYLFARKFDESVCKEVLDKIDEDIK